MKYLDYDQVKARLSMAALIPAMEQALRDFSTGRVVQPVRTIVPVEQHGGFMLTMPVLCEGLGAKLVTVYPRNAARGIKTHWAMILLFNPATGEPLAVMDGTRITTMRTAAVSAVATKFLSRQNSKVLAILGSGVQARSHVEALRLVRKFSEVRVWSRTPEHARRFAEEAQARECRSPEEAVREADVVVTATSSSEPVLQGTWLKAGAHVNGVGWTGREGRELDDDVMRNVVYVESRESARLESADIVLSKAEIYAEIGEVVAGSKAPHTEATTVFKSLGMAVEDVVAAMLVLHANK